MNDTARVEEKRILMICRHTLHLRRRYLDSQEFLNDRFLGFKVTLHAEFREALLVRQVNVFAKVVVRINQYSFTLTRGKIAQPLHHFTMQKRERGSIRLLPTILITMPAHLAVTEKIRDSL